MVLVSLWRRVGRRGWWGRKGGRGGGGGGVEEMEGAGGVALAVKEEAEKDPERWGWGEEVEEEVKEDMEGLEQRWWWRDR